MKVWRIEHMKTKEGPFQGPGLTSEFLNFLPGPLTDCNHNIQDGEFVGCLTLHDLILWIADYNSLKKLGYKIVRKNVIKILAVGNYQVIFI